MDVLVQMRSMADFDPTEPAIVHDCASGRIETWTGDEAADYVACAKLRNDGTVEWKAYVFDGWGDVLGG